MLMPGFEPCSSVVRSNYSTSNARTTATVHAVKTLSQELFLGVDTEHDWPKYWC